MYSPFKKLLIASTFAIASITTPAIAEIGEDKGWYMTVGSGIVFPGESDLDSTINDVKYTGDADFTGSFSGDIGIGHDFGNVRTELTYGYTPMTSDSVTVTDGTTSATVPLAIEYKVHSLQAGLYYDFTNDINKWNPYIGGTLGWANVSIGDTTTTIDGTSYNVNANDDSSLIYQAKVGLGYAASEKTDLFVEAGYQGLGETSWNYSCPAGNTCSNLNSGSFGGFLAKAGFRIRFKN